MPGPGRTDISKIKSLLLRLALCMIQVCRKTIRVYPGLPFAICQSSWEGQLSRLPPRISVVYAGNWVWRNWPRKGCKFRWMIIKRRNLKGKRLLEDRNFKLLDVFLTDGWSRCNLKQRAVSFGRWTCDPDSVHVMENRWFPNIWSWIPDAKSVSITPVCPFI